MKSLFAVRISAHEDLHLPTGRPLRLASGKIINPRGLITGGLPPYAETRNYVSSIISLVAQPSDFITKTVLVPALPNQETRRTRSRDQTSDKSINSETRSRPKSNPTNSFIEVP
jgi:hypothetical protein